MEDTPTVTTTSQGPSGVNQTSEDHGPDSNQAARQPTTQEIIDDEGAATEIHVPS